jgi:hypothetical protein
VGSEVAVAAYEKDEAFPSAVAKGNETKYGEKHKRIDITP